MTLIFERPRRELRMRFETLDKTWNKLNIFNTEKKKKEGK